jgi:hypothetical protein
VTTVPLSSPLIQGTVAIQGYDIDKKTPAGESIVEIPIDVLKEAVSALGR